MRFEKAGRSDLTPAAAGRREVIGGDEHEEMMPIKASRRPLQRSTIVEKPNHTQVWWRA
jgi:hypothetical protein